MPEMDQLFSMLSNRSSLPKEVVEKFVDLGNSMLDHAVETLPEYDGSLWGALGDLEQLDRFLDELLPLALAAAGACGCEDCKPTVQELLKKVCTPETKALASAARELIKQLTAVSKLLTFSPTEEVLEIRKALDQRKRDREQEEPKTNDCSHPDCGGCSDNPEVSEVRDETIDGPGGENSKPENQDAVQGEAKKAE